MQTSDWINMVIAVSSGAGSICFMFGAALLKQIWDTIKRHEEDDERRFKEHGDELLRCRNRLHLLEGQVPLLDLRIDNLETKQ